MPVVQIMLTDVADNRIQGLTQGVAQSTSSLLRAAGPFTVSILFSHLSAERRACVPRTEPLFFAAVHAVWAGIVSGLLCAAVMFFPRFCESNGLGAVGSGPPQTADEHSLWMLHTHTCITARDVVALSSAPVPSRRTLL
jgi:hypothetical protein